LYPYPVYRIRSVPPATADFISPNDRWAIGAIPAPSVRLARSAPRYSVALRISLIMLGQCSALSTCGTLFSCAFG
jgi:hypothetical protein